MELLGSGNAFGSPREVPGHRHVTGHGATMESRAHTSSQGPWMVKSLVAWIWTLSEPDIHIFCIILIGERKECLTARSYFWAIIVE